MELIKKYFKNLTPEQTAQFEKLDELCEKLSAAVSKQA